MLFWRARVVYRMRQEADYQKARADSAERDRQALEARLVTLKAQIEPSFLSDTMRNVQQLVQHQPAEAAVMLTNLILELTGQQQTHQELIHQARVDPLTGLPNRRAFEELLEQAHKRAVREGGCLVVLFLDLDDFKRVNDTLGHALGDAVLRAFSERVRTAVREVDVVARLGGDEFVVLLDSPEAPDAADTVVRKIEAALAPPLAIGDGEILVRASIGVARCLASTTTPPQVLEVADAAMYEDKARRKWGLLPAAATNVAAKLQ
jgi:diguanylate cyclase (GGDEF)-like protein